MPWRPGQSGNPTGIGTAGGYLETMQLARAAGPKAIAKLIERLDSQDERISVVAATAILERAYGRPREMDMKDAQGPAIIDLSKLSPHELEVLMKIAKSIRPAEDDPVGTVRDAEVETIGG